MDAIRITNLIISVAGMTLSAFGLMQAILDRYVENKVRRFFITIFSFLILYTTFIMIREVSYDQSGFGWVMLSRFALFSQAFLSSILEVLIICFLLHQSGEKNCVKQKSVYIAFGLWIVYVVILIYAQFSRTIYHINNENVYERGKYFPVLLVMPFFITVVNLITLKKKWNNLSKKEREAFALYAIIPFITILIQMFYRGVHMIVLGTVTAAMVMFAYIISDQADVIFRQQEENAQLKIDILLAQIHPHFLYNSLSSIKYLCGKDPKKAEEAVVDFSAYLRHNMDSITMDKSIPFEAELKHVEQYVKLQKLRFEDDLDVKYNLECKDFDIPTLTLQPLVENAISYGVRKSETGRGIVTISSRKYEDRIEISVKDDGPGFVYEEQSFEEDRSHNGIKNVKERLKRIAGGDLKVESGLGEGTTITIILPQGDE